MTTIKFSQDSEEIIVKVLDIFGTEYCNAIWPSSYILSFYIFKNPLLFRDKRILELSAGAGIPGILASKIGSRVTYSEKSLECLDISKNSTIINEVFDHSQFLILKWGEVTHEMVQIPPFDIIISSDCFYDEKDFDDILMTISFFIKRNSAMVVYITYEIRSVMIYFDRLLKEWNLTAHKIEVQPLIDEFTELEKFSQKIELLKITSSS